MTARDRRRAPRPIPRSLFGIVLAVLAFASDSRAEGPAGRGGDRPHVTLARRCVQPQARATVAPITWEVRNLCLVGSELHADGPVHATLAQWPLTVDD